MRPQKISGAIFDVGDTLLDNKPDELGKGLHEQSRMAAVQEVGKRHKIAELEAVTPQQNLDAFLNASEHSMNGAAWELLTMFGLVDGGPINHQHPLLLEIVELKNSLHEKILREQGQEVPGSSKFVKALADIIPDKKLAIASSAFRRDIDIYLEMSGLAELFLPERIKSKSDCQHPKPNPEIFNLAFQSLNLPEADRQYVCAFEDDPRGIMSAKAAGLYTCAIAT